ncbi:MAG: hypothetical protein AAFP90_09090 [Planctomycetota bacterium]
MALPALLGFRVPRFRLNRPTITQMMDRKTRRALIRAGAFVRRRARSQLRRRKRVSRPGQPPSVHSRDKFATLKNILFAFDERSFAVIVGPREIGRRYPNILPGETVGEVQEVGGRMIVFEIQQSRGRWLAVSFNRYRSHIGRKRTRTVTVRSRPNMVLALRREMQADTLPQEIARA